MDSRGVLMLNVVLMYVLVIAILLIGLDFATKAFGTAVNKRYRTMLRSMRKRIVRKVRGLWCRYPTQIKWLGAGLVLGAILF